MKRGYSKEGLSTVVATLLIILLSIVAIGILWVVMRNFVVNQSELVEMKNEFFAENIEMSSIKVNDNFISFSLKKTGGKANLKGQTEENVITGVVEADIISVVDLSGSMLSCKGVSASCCSNNLGGDIYDSSSSICYGVDLSKENNCISICGGILDNRISITKDANKELINILSASEGSRIGLVGYNTNVDSSASLDLTDDLNQLNNKIDSWQSSGSTCICCGINEALKKLQQQSTRTRAKKIIVMSDGEANINCDAQNTGDPMTDAIKASCDAAASLDNLTVYSIGIGQNVNERTLTNISNCGGGIYYSAVNISDLIDVYRRVAEEIKYTSRTINKFNYLYVVFYNKTSSYKEKISKIPEVLELTSYNFDLTGKLEGNITKIEIYPVILSDRGKEVIGPMFDSWELK